MSDLFSYWSILSLIGNFIQLPAGLLILIKYGNLQVLSLLLGIGTFIGWVSTLSFIVKSPEYYVIFRTLELAAPKITRVLFAVAPVYIGFALVSTCLFWKSLRFKDTQDSFASMLPMFWGNNAYVNYQSLMGCVSILG